MDMEKETRGMERELSSKIPEKDLEVSGGFKESPQFVRIDGSTEPPEIDDRYRWRNYFEENGELKKGFFTYHGKVYKDSQRSKKSGFSRFSATVGGVDWAFKEGEQENGIPIEELIKEVY